MATKKTPENWGRSFRRQIRLACGDGWTVVNSRGRIRLEAREGDNRESVMLPYEWHEANSLPALKRIE